MIIVRCVDLWAVYTIAAGYSQKATAALFNAMTQDGTSVVEQAIQDGADVNGFDTNGFTPTFYAAAHPQKFDILRVLLLNGCDINHLNNYGESVLNRAVSLNNRAVAKLLIEFGADVSIMNLSDQHVKFLDSIIIEINDENKLAFSIINQFFYENKRNIVFAQTMGQLLALPEIPLVSDLRKAMSKKH